MDQRDVAEKALVVIVGRDHGIGNPVADAALTGCNIRQAKANAIAGILDVQPHIADAMRGGNHPAPGNQRTAAFKPVFPVERPLGDLQQFLRTLQLHLPRCAARLGREPVIHPRHRTVFNDDPAVVPLPRLAPPPHLDLFRRFRRLDHGIGRWNTIVGQGNAICACRRIGAAPIVITRVLGRLLVLKHRFHRARIKLGLRGWLGWAEGAGCSRAWPNLRGNLLRAEQHDQSQAPPHRTHRSPSFEARA